MRSSWLEAARPSAWLSPSSQRRRVTEPAPPLAAPFPSVTPPATTPTPAAPPTEAIAAVADGAAQMASINPGCSRPRTTARASRLSSCGGRSASLSRCRSSHVNRTKNSATSSETPEAGTAVVSAHAVVAISSGWKASMRDAASTAAASNSAGALTPAVANAHTAIVIACGDPSPIRAAIRGAMALKSGGDRCRALAKAWASMASPCIEKLSIPSSPPTDRAASSVNMSGDGRPTLARRVTDGRKGPRSPRHRRGREEASAALHHASKSTKDGRWRWRSGVRVPQGRKVLFRGLLQAVLRAMDPCVPLGGGGGAGGSHCLFSMRPRLCKGPCQLRHVVRREVGRARPRHAARDGVQQLRGGAAGLGEGPCRAGQEEGRQACRLCNSYRYQHVQQARAGGALCAVIEPNVGPRQGGSILAGQLKMLGHSCRGELVQQRGLRTHALMRAWAQPPASEACAAIHTAAHGPGPVSLEWASEWSTPAATAGLARCRAETVCAQTGASGPPSSASAWLSHQLRFRLGSRVNT
eukprot:scaffold20328_cov116-Isochrysis_galbana.AAC.6